MAGGYKATLDVKCWKEHTCCYCGAPYRYVVQKKMTGRGRSQADAASAAKAAGVRAARSALRLQPCPGCGNFQPDMIGARRLSRHARLFLVTVAVLLSVSLLGAFEMTPGWLALVLLVLFAGPVLLINTWIGARNPNRNLRVNKALAERLVANHELQAMTAETDANDRPRAVAIETGVGYWVAFLLLAATLLLMPGAELMRVAGGWKSNPDWHPGIVGPGDTAWTRVTTNQPIASLRGEWRATGSGKIINARKHGINQESIDLPRVSSRAGPWTEAVEKGEGEVVPIKLWARVEFPTHRQLTRQRVQIELNLKVTYPERGERGNVVDKTEEVTYATSLEMSSQRAGFQYGFFWYIATIGGGLMFLLAGAFHLLRDAALKRCGLPTRVVAAGEEAVAEPPPMPEAAQPKQGEQESPTVS
jgi:hypothetical protein